MSLCRFHLWCFAAFVACLGFAAPAAAHTHACCAASHGAPIASVFAPGADGGGLAQRGACCGISMFSCCAAGSLVPIEPVSEALGGKPVFAGELADFASGIAPARVKKPPRSSR